jgi:hypothetical protein
MLWSPTVVVVVLVGGGGELALIPEAPVWMGALAFCAFIVWREWRNRRRIERPRKETQVSKLQSMDSKLWT